jgi:Zn-finger nucleic acid-binding protein
MPTLIIVVVQETTYSGLFYDGKLSEKSMKVSRNGQPANFSCSFEMEDAAYYLEEEYKKHAL